MVNIITLGGYHMRKFILLLLIVLLLCIIGGFLGRNIFLKYILEDRLGQMNQAYVKIDSVESNPFEKFIVLNGIHIESHEKKGTDFIRIMQLKTYYDLDYNHKKVELYDTEIMGLEFITPKDRDLRKKLHIEVVKDNFQLGKAFKEDAKEQTDKLKESHEYKNIKEAFQNMKMGKDGLDLDLDSIKDNLNKIREKYLGEDSTQKNVNVDNILSQYLTKTYEEEIYDILLRYREIVKELEERLQRDLERKDNVWEFHMNRVSIFFDIYGISFNGEVKNFSSRLSKNYSNIPFKLFGEKNDDIGMLKGELNILKLELNSAIDIPELDLVSIPEVQKYLVDGVASLQQDIHLDKYHVMINGTLLGKRMRLAENPFVEKVQDLEVKYRYDSRDRQLHIKSRFLKNKIDELGNY